MFYGPFTNEAKVVTEVLCSTWHSCWGLTSNLSHDGICHSACSLSCQGIFFCLLEAIILLTQWATPGSDLNLLPSPGQLPLLLKKLGHTITSISSFPVTQYPYNPGLEEQLSVQEWSKEGAFSAWAHDVTFLRQWNFNKEKYLFPQSLLEKPGHFLFTSCRKWFS